MSSARPEARLPAPRPEVGTTEALLSTCVLWLVPFAAFVVALVLGP